MANAKLSGSGARRTPRHQWTDEQKRCLLCLFTPSYPTDHERTTAFNKIFRPQINREDFPDGLPYTSLKAQHQEHRRRGWPRITALDSTEAEVARREVLAEKIRQVLGVTDREPPSRPRSRDIISHSLSSTTRKGRADALEDSTSAPSDRESLIHISPPGAKTARAKAILISRAEVRDRRSYTDAIHDNDGAMAPETEDHAVARTKPQILKLSTRKMPEGFTRTGPQQPPGMELFVRSDGSAIWLFPEEMHIAMSPWKAPSEQEVLLPPAGLVFRFWDNDHSRAKMSAHGIVAEKYATSNCLMHKPPPVEYLDCTDLLNHLDQRKKETPFVTVSDSLVWCLSKVLKKVKKGEWQNAHVSVVDAHALDPKAVFHALPFYKQFQERWWLMNENARGISAHEFLIWNKIPRSAIIKTFAVCDVVRVAASSHMLGQLLCLNEISSDGDYQQHIRRQLRQKGVSITTNVASALAEVALFVGLTHSSSFSHHRHLINDLVSSYGLVVNYHSEEAWQDRAGAYAHIFCRRSETAVSITDQQKLKAAFLEGVCLGATRQFRWTKISPPTSASVDRTAKRVGLKDRVRVAADECDAAKLHLLMEQARQRKLLKGGGIERLVEDAVGGDHDEDDDDYGGLFEITSDGLVV